MLSFMVSSKLSRESKYSQSVCVFNIYSIVYSISTMSMYSVHSVSILNMSSHFVQVIRTFGKYN